MNATVALAMFPLMLVLIILGVPVAMALIIPAAIGGWFAFGPMMIDQLYGNLFSSATNYILAAIPLFVLMGAILEKSGIAEKLYAALQILLGRLPGGLAIATIAMGAIFAAAAGVVGAVEIMIGMMAIPAMKKYHYRHEIIAGTVCAGGSLGTMIPPSVVAIVYASLARISVGEVFAALLFPGLIMVILFMAYIVIHALLQRKHTPAWQEADALPFAKKARRVITGLLPALLLIVCVLGSLMSGLASPTEAAAVGVAGALLLSLLHGRFHLAMLYAAIRSTVAISAMILFIVAGGLLFTGVFAANGGVRLIQSTLAAMQLGPGMTIFLFLLIVFILGFFLDWTANVLITVPIFVPVLLAMQVDLIWFGALLLIVIQTSYLTPPMASSIFYLLSIAPPDMRYGQICRGVVPFIAMQLLTLLAVIFFPTLATWLPARLFGF